MRVILGMAVAAAYWGILQIGLAEEAGVCISSDLGLAGVKPGDCFASGEAEALLDKAVLNEDRQAVTHQMSNALETKTVTTCREYISLNSDEEWTPPGERFDEICNSVMMLSGAQPAAQSFLRSGDADLRDIGRISILVLPALGELDPMALPNMQTVADVVATGEVVAAVSTDSKASLGLKYKDIFIAYRLLARGDVDNDGFEDLLVERRTGGPGSERSVYPLLMTRVERDGLLVLNAQFGD
jgi:hypothetical protein